MLTKTAPDEVLPFLTDASNMPGGGADRVVFAESAGEVAATLAEATRNRTSVTVSGAGTGIVGGRVPFGGIVLATDRLNKIGAIVKESNGGHGTAQAGVILADYQKAATAAGLFYPPDPTEWSCFLGGTVATNASGARTFKYGPTRRYVRALQIALATGQLISLRRGEIHATADGLVRLPTADGQVIEAQLPTYQMPRTSKHASGYFVETGMDAIDLFIGSEGTLGVITEVETALLEQPMGLLSGVIFFAGEAELLDFVADARAQSKATRIATNPKGLDARAIEYFDSRALNFLRHKFPSIPEGAAGAIFFEQETTPETEDALLTAWSDLIDQHQALADDSWFATNEREQQNLRDFRHALPVLVNEWLTRHYQRKVSTDMAVPDAEFASMLRFYQEQLNSRGFEYVIFGHIGDNHVHVNILPRDDLEAERARQLYAAFIRRAVSVGGTISAEHGIGKIKRNYLRELYGDEHLREMARLKKCFDPAGILGRGIMFDESLIETA